MSINNRHALPRPREIEKFQGWHHFVTHPAVNILAAGVARRLLLARVARIIGRARMYIIFLASCVTSSRWYV